MRNFLIFILPTLLCSCCIEQPKEEPPVIEEPIVIPVERGYEEIREYSILWDNMFSIQSDSYYVYFYSLSCNHCAEIKDYIIEKALERKDIYFVRSSGKDILRSDVKSSIGATFAGDISILGYPSLIKIVDHKCVKNLAGKTNIKNELK